MTESERLKQYLKKRVEDGWAGGLAAATTDDNGAVLFGAAGSSVGAAFGERSLVNVGSVAKAFTATLLAKLVEEGELTLTDKVSSIVPEYPFGDVEFFHLLSHSAGYEPEDIHVKRPLLQEGEQGRQAFMSSIYGIRERKREAGEAVRYFTEGYAIIADVIERVADTDLNSFARETLFDPLGMLDSTFDAAKARAAGAVYPTGTDGKTMTELADWATTGDSGLYTNLLDLLKFGRMLLNGGQSGEGRTVLHECTASALLRDASGGAWNQTPAFWIKGGRDRYGCFAELHSPRAVGHTGFSGCMLWIDPDSELAGAVVSDSTALHADWSRYKRINNRLLSLRRGPGLGRSQP